MSELLIPFGLHRDTGSIVEPEDAAKGRACDCLCPGCKAPLLSRHPKDKRHHFAHDSRHPLARPEDECPFSSAVAVAMMVRNMAPHFVGMYLTTPALWVEEHFDCCGASEPTEVTKVASNRIDAVQASASCLGRSVDLRIMIGRYPVVVDLVYKGKLPIDICDADLQQHKVALLQLDCDSFSMSSFKAARNLRFSEAVLQFVLSQGAREWRFHPNAQAVRMSARSHHHCRRPTFSRRQPLSPMQGPTVESSKAGAVNHPSRAFECIMCNTKWQHDYGAALKCPKCRTHLYAREI